MGRQTGMAHLRPYLRVLLAWLFAMQPLTAAYAGAGMGGPTIELCRPGAVTPELGGELPAPAMVHHQALCCTTVCAGGGVAPCCQTLVSIVLPRMVAASLPAPGRVDFPRPSTSPDAHSPRGPPA